MNSFLIGIIATILFSFSCFSQTSKDKVPNYFPIENSDNISNRVLDSFLNTWYSKQLFALGEPILFSRQNGKHSVYRLTILRTFANPYTIRIENCNDTIMLYWKECDGSGGYEPGRLIKDKRRALTIEDWKIFENYLTEIDFWNLPLVVEDELVKDDTSEILEGLKTNEYHVITKWDQKKVDISKIFIFLIELTDIEFKQLRD
jgi:hypothetical protein